MSRGLSWSTSTNASQTREAPAKRRRSIDKGHVLTYLLLLVIGAIYLGPMLMLLNTALKTPGFMASAPHVAGIPIVFNLPAAAITALVTWVLVIGIKESARFNTAMVVLKLFILVFFIIVGAFYVKPANWHPFAPNGWAGTCETAFRPAASRSRTWPRS